MALSLDGFASTNVATGSTGPASVSVTLTTSNNDDIIVVAVHWFTTNGTVGSSANGPPNISSMSGAGLQWALRSRTPIATTFSGIIHFLDIWWAVAPTALTSQTITANYGALVGGFTYGEMFAFGVTGADLLLPWDLNTSLPAVSAIAASGGSGNHTISGISSDNSSIMQLNFLAVADNTAPFSGTQTLDASFTTIGQRISGHSALLAEYQVLSSALSSASQDVFASVSGITTNYISVVDCIKAGPTTSWAGPVYVNSGTLWVATPTTQTPTLPSNRTNGNLLLAIADYTSVTSTPTWSAGWTVIETWHGAAGSNQSGTKAYCFVTGSETAPTISWSGGVEAGMAQVHQFTNVHQTTPIGASQHNASTSLLSGTVTCPALITTADNSLVFSFIDVGQLSPPAPPPKWMGATAGTGGPPGTYGANTSSWDLIPSSGTTSDSVTVNFALGNTNAWLSFLTEILAASSIIGGEADGQATALGAWASTAAVGGEADGQASTSTVSNPMPVGGEADGQATAIGGIPATVSASDTFTLYGDNPAWTWVQALSQNLTASLTQAQLWAWGRTISERLPIGFSQAEQTNYHSVETDIIRLADALGAGFPIILSQEVTVSQTQHVAAVLVLLQQIRAIDTPAPQNNYHLVLANALLLADSVINALPGILTQGFSISLTQAAQRVFSPPLAQALTVGETFTNALMFSFSDMIDLTPTQLLQAIYNGDPLLDGINLVGLQVSPSGTMTTWAVNTRTNAITEYTNYGFNSFASMGLKYIAANSTGIYELDGDDDAGTDIIADIISGFFALNSTKMSGLKGAYLAVRGEGQFILKLIAGDGREYLYEVTTPPNLMNTKVNVGKGLRTRYMAFQLTSTGQDYDLDSIEFVPMLSDRRV